MIQEYKRKSCPNCGKTIIPKLIDNTKGPVHPVDVILCEKMPDLFFPHYDVDYVCSCGYKEHYTVLPTGEEPSKSISVKAN